MCYKIYNWTIITFHLGCTSKQHRNFIAMMVGDSYFQEHLIFIGQLLNVFVFRASGGPQWTFSHFPDRSLVESNWVTWLFVLKGWEYIVRFFAYIHERLSYKLKMCILRTPRFLNYLNFNFVTFNRKTYWAVQLQFDWFISAVSI